ncbi:unnamed protein product [Cuscuta campestris]|uniref:Retrotransposon gag domain-containing protein n=1 Tax=Cuscuta campestris TaxID=132261 RepID=A0A484KPU8_9ASTE|nr:unnamed protein product [Cuscuta campestris]
MSRLNLQKGVPNFEEKCDRALGDENCIRKFQSFRQKGLSAKVMSLKTIDPLWWGRICHGTPQPSTSLRTAFMTGNLPVKHPTKQESMSEAWDRLKKLKIKFPPALMDSDSLMFYFYKGLLVASKKELDHSSKNHLTSQCPLNDAPNPNKAREVNLARYENKANIEPNPKEQLRAVTLRSEKQVQGPVDEEGEDVPIDPSVESESNGKIKGSEPKGKKKDESMQKESQLSTHKANIPFC